MAAKAGWLGGAWGIGMALALFSFSLPAGAQPAPAAPAAETDAAKALRYTRALEADPLADDALAMRKWLLRWIQETPDYTVNVCDIFGLSPGPKAPLGGELLVQMMAGNVAYQIEHDEPSDEAARQLASLESVLRMYASYRRADPKWVVPALEPLVVQQRNGTLRDLVRDRTAEACTGEKVKGTVVEDGESEPAFLGGFLRESHVVYPLKVPVGWEFLGEHRFDDPEAGASVRFHREGDKTGWMDVYFYPMGVIPPKLLAQLAATERNNLLTAWKDAFTGAPLSALDTFTVPVGVMQSVPADRQPRPSKITAYAADFSYIHKEDGKRYHSAMVFMVDRLYAIKLRYSADADALSRGKVRKEAEAFARELLAQLDISSTGGCGSKAMSEEGMMADGCVGEGAIQPLVTAGRRELRFEYPAAR